MVIAAIFKAKLKNTLRQQLGFKEDIENVSNGPNFKYTSLTAKLLQGFFQSL